VFRIGEFSRIAQVSCRLLRYYDELGLLRPGHVDPETGYRSYQAEQLNRLNRILVLRDLGFSLEQIARLLEQHLGADELRGMLRLRQSELERELAEKVARVELIEQRIEDLEAGAVQRGEIVVRAEPAAWILTRRDAYGSFDEARARVAALQAARQARPPLDLGRMLVIQHAPAFEPDELDLEIGFLVEASPDQLPAAPERELLLGEHALRIRLLPKQDRLATIVRVGPPETAHRQAGALAREIEASGYVLDGPNRELFLRGPSPKQAPIVEMQYPIRLRAAAGR
jgi:DNA-binding transcriptional MerR regulator